MPSNIHEHTEEILISESQLQTRVKEIAGKISRDYSDRAVMLIGVLKGSLIFVADLLRNISGDVTADFICVSSYEGARSGGKIKLVMDVKEDLAGKHVLLVEDIVDTGATLAFLQELILARRPASLRTCVLLDKFAARTVPVTIDYRGFSIPEKFIVGYGLDYRERYRGLPYIGVLRDEIIQKGKEL